MMRTRRLIVLTSVALLLAAWMLLAGPVLLRLNLDPGALQPPFLTLLNPFRDRGPERVADAYLRRLSTGELAEARRYFGANREAIEVREPQYPPLNWKIANRADESGHVTLTYTITRGGGYRGASTAIVVAARHAGQWRIATYNAWY
jgi:hypothetical protein